MKTPVASRGFTLMEMLVVLVLMSIAVGLVGFGLQQGLSTASERRAVGDMVEALRATRVRAIVTGQPARTEFDLRKATFKAPGKREKRWPESLRVTLQTASDLGSSVEFYPDGGSSGGNVLVADGERRWRIDIGWLTGSVQVRSL
ncbi:Tfp pilus assembly protein FimT/FimU [Pseudomonas cannabina]|uniref:General secretion pathway protein H n=5 Tax=Pseudomonas syringae group TaxID=136849 RepID=A0A0N0XBM7_PSESX|nr:MULTISPECIES: prepilin-type N-terminal cleavage/methylation domain-containing protein [Pseudomonas syringae group]KPB71737.1 General secretion pathway protein H [Pseudomonas syringae pv. maculicola]KPC33776.1 General secretion pathway protein H [Pseudomonas syringae pv. cilantro]KPW71115.1 proteinral secretion pathway protein H [Pseudomonas syringae pv. coriandricola]MBM0138381.1 prepilin-type N-terminal cleavage/methylation domain-containing protein [Pseudomonas cannabina pv. alisalensis]Q